MIWVIIINLKFRLRQCFGLKVQDVRAFLALWLAKYVCSFWVLIENIFWQAAPFVRSHHFNLFTWCVYTHTHACTHLFLHSRQNENFCQSQIEIYISFFRRKPKMILLHIILISLEPEIEKKWRNEGGKHPMLLTTDKCRSQDSSHCFISKCSTWPPHPKNLFW